MARGSDAAKTGATSAQNLSNQNAGNAQALYGAVAPELMAEASHPAGYSPTDLASMNTAAQQSAGGSMGGAVGQGALLASRTRNAGTADAAIGQAARDSSANLSKAAVGIQGKNADLKQKQRQAGLSGLEGLTGMSTGASINALGQVAGNVNADTNAQNASWDWSKNLLQPILGAAGGAYGNR